MCKQNLEDRIVASRSMAANCMPMALSCGPFVEKEV